MELDHTSHSAVEEYKKCPQRFYLSRILKVESTQWLAGPAGSAFHTMTEDYDNGVPVRAFHEYLNENLEEGVLYTHSRGEDYDWWVASGPYLFDQYRKWRDDTGWEVEAVEEEFRIQPAGLQWPVVGFIDRRFRSPRTGTSIICDIKTGYRLPVDSPQLKIYKVADDVRRAGETAARLRGSPGAVPEGPGEAPCSGTSTAGLDSGVKVAVNYYDARRGSSTGLEWPVFSEADLVEHIGPVERGILADDWTAKPGAQCRYCPVRKHCSFKKGK